jgi:hypothetical protein
MKKNTSYPIIFSLVIASIMMGATAGLSFTGSKKAFAITLHDGGDPRSDEDRRGNFSIKIHPFIDKATLRLPPSTGAGTQAFHLVGPGDVDEFIRSRDAYIASYLSNPYVQVKSKEESRPGLGMGARSRRWSHRFAFDGVELCDGGLNSFLLSEGSIALLGSIPQVDSDETPVGEENWPSLATISAVLQSKNPTLFNEKTPIREAARCYYARFGRMHAGWRITFAQEGLGYQALLDHDEVFSLSELFFDLSTDFPGQVQAYATNPLDATLKTYSATLNSQTSLDSAYFTTTTTSGNSKVARATSTDATFIYPASDPRFPEASVFINATNMLNYFSTLGYSWSGVKPLILNVHAVVDGTVNNALYQPDVNGSPHVSIGDGDGLVLQNLPLDADVVHHEFSHHVIFDKLKTTSGESLIVHEGLADTFSFFYKGDACLGPSVCPEKSSLCVIAGKCLRSGDNSLQYLSDEYRDFGAHQKGQIISGINWNLYKKIGAEKMLKIVYHSINFFTPDADFAIVFSALLLADQDLYKGEHACTILEEINARGFNEMMAEVDCKNPTTWSIALSTTSGSSSSSTSSSSSGGSSNTTSSKKSGCGTLAGFVGDDEPWGGAGLLLLLLMPLVVGIREIWRRSRVRAAGFNKNKKAEDSSRFPAPPTPYSST